MAYVPPNSIIKLLAGVPCDSTMHHTLWFQSRVLQEAYFTSKVVRTFTQVSYVRKGVGVIKVEAPADQLYACNYMMYQNTSYSNKWFYAFCNVEYINDKTSQITFVIDPIQTWFFDITLGQCYVEREHSTTDVAGDNLIPEGLETGDYIYEDNDLDWCYQFTSYDVMVYCTFSAVYDVGTGTWEFHNTTSGAYTWGIFSGLSMRIFRSIETQATQQELSGFVQAVTAAGKSEGIVAMVMIPHTALDNNLLPNQVSHTIPKITSIDGYVPKNKKLLTSPYCFIEAQNCEGATAILPQEYFGGANPSVCQFMITFNITVAPVAVCVPVNYKGAEYALQECMYINNFSQCSWNTDLYKAYMAQSLTAKIGSVLTDAVSGSGDSLIGLNHQLHQQADEIHPIRDAWNEGHFSLTNFNQAVAENAVQKWALRAGANISGMAGVGLNAMLDPISGALGNQALQGALGTAAANLLFGGNVAGAIFNDLSQQYSRSVAAPHNNGGNTPDYLTSNRIKGFWFYHRTIRREFAEIIDQYFSRFGYACKRIKVPNIHARAYWTYTKTVGCEVSGPVPSDVISTVQSIFDSGITFWADPNNFGNYSLDNIII